MYEKILNYTCVIEDALFILYILVKTIFVGIVNCVG